jgi:hypothetical protein
MTLARRAIKTIVGFSALYYFGFSRTDEFSAWWSDKCAIPPLALAGTPLRLQRRGGAAWRRVPGRGRLHAALQRQPLPERSKPARRPCSPPSRRQLQRAEYEVAAKEMAKVSQPAAGGRARAGRAGAVLAHQACALAGRARAGWGVPAGPARRCDPAAPPPLLP